MFKLRLAAAAAIACAVTLLSSGAQAYPDCGVSLSLNNSTVVGGKSFTFIADAGDTHCKWTVKYRGQVKKGSGTSISGSFSTPEVDKKDTSKIRAACKHKVVDAPAATSSTSSDVAPAFYSAGTATVLQAKMKTCRINSIVTLLPKGGVDDSDDSALPDTGGSNLWLLVLGGALVVGGAGVTYASRRRHSSH